MSLAFSVSALAGLGGFGLGLFLPVVVLPPYGKETLIPGLGFGISGGGIRIHLLAGLLHRFGLLRSLLCQLRRRCRVGFGAGFQILQSRLFPIAVGFQPFRFFRGEGQARLGTLGKFFQRPLLGLRGLRGFLLLPAPLHRLGLSLLVRGKPFRFLRGEVGSGPVQLGKFLQ